MNDLLDINDKKWLGEFGTILTNTGIKVRHNAGMCSCFTVRLISIIKYWNKFNKLPMVDSSEQLYYYKDESGADLMPRYFGEYNERGDLPQRIEINEDYMDIQWLPYRAFNFDSLNYLIKKYFMPTKEVKDLVEMFIDKYDLRENICTVFYRGNDKYLETKIASHQEFIDKAKEIKGVRYLVQTDELEFLQAFREEFPNALFIVETTALSKFNGSVQFVLPKNERPAHGINFLAALIVHSRSQHLITHSGNCGLWSVLYRGHGRNIHQYCNGQWI